MDKRTWLSVHLYSYNLAINEIVFNFIPKYLNSIQIKDLHFKYFFIRYYDDFGSHVRLRLDIDDDSDIKLIKSTIEKDYSSFYSQTAIRFSNSTAEKQLVRYIQYEPEIGRYGGRNTIPICENIFHLSSKTIINLRKDFDFHNYSSIIPVALKLHLIFVMGLKLEMKIILELLSSTIKFWIPYAFETVINDKTYALSREEKINICLDNYNKAYLANKENISLLLTDTLISLKYRKYSKNDPFNRWFLESKSLNNQIKICLTKTEPVNINNKLFSIHSSLIHMTNNRIGVSNVDEAYLAYILFKFLTEKSQSLD